MNITVSDGAEQINLTEEEELHLKNIEKRNQVKPGEILDEYIQKYVRNLLSENKESHDIEIFQDYFSDSFAELVEKLCILHCRMWWIEGKIAEISDAEEVMKLKRMIDSCFKVRRPRLVMALNKIIEAAVLHGKSLSEESVKLYKGFQS